MGDDERRRRRRGLPPGARRGRCDGLQAGLATQATAKALEAAAFTAQSLERQLGRLTKDVDDHNVTPGTGCNDRWSHYCGAVYDAIRWARDRGKGVIVGTQPYGPIATSSSRVRWRVCCRSGSRQTPRFATSIWSGGRSQESRAHLRRHAPAEGWQSDPRQRLCRTGAGPGEGCWHAMTRSPAWVKDPGR